MNKIVQALITLVALCLAFLGVIFVIAGGLENIAAGGAMLLVALLMFYFVFRVEKVEAAKPTLVSQTFNVKVEGSGQMTAKEVKCKSCGAPITAKDMKVVQGGLMATCPYCGVAFALEEAPKW
jgi:DNA-directed RNA polymerase subunit RPC12/RpoP